MAAADFRRGYANVATLLAADDRLCRSQPDRAMRCGPFFDDEFDVHSRRIPLASGKNPFFLKSPASLQAFFSIPENLIGANENHPIDSDIFHRVRCRLNMVK